MDRKDIGCLVNFLKFRLFKKKESMGSSVFVIPNKITFFLVCLTLFPVIVSSLTGAATLAKPDTNSNVAGTINGHFLVDSSGNGSYTIPVKIPPGTSKHRPKLTLVYSSRSPNGLLGMGWSLQGLSRIQRCPTTIAQDGTPGTITYTPTDRFCLDGQRLIAVENEQGKTLETYQQRASAYFENGTVFHTEIESWRKIVSQTTSKITGPVSFQVYTKKGDVLEYGVTDSSRIKAVGKSAVRIWALNKVTDLNGNYYTITYGSDSESGDYYPETIAYTGNEQQQQLPQRFVNFKYETRPDIRTTYLGGSLIEKKSRLSTISVTLNSSSTEVTQPAIVSNYDFSYKQGISTGRSLLETITLSSGNDQSLPPTTFVYSDIASASERFQQPPSSETLTVSGGYTASAAILPADFNGDGLMDFVNIGNNASNLVIVPYVSTTSTNASGDSVVTFTQETGMTSTGGNNGNCPMIQLDPNGDGLTDLACILTSGDEAQITLFFPMQIDGSWTFVQQTTQTVTAENVSNTKLIAADVNGDGNSDLVYQWTNENSQAEFSVLFSNGCKADKSKCFNDLTLDSTASTLQPTGYRSFITDVNGDSRADLVYAMNTYPPLVLVSLYDGTAFTSPNLYSLNSLCDTSNPNSANGSFISTDINGDGKSDLVYSYGENNQCLVPLISDGDNSFVAQSPISSTVNKYVQAQSVDVNGDNLNDLFFTNSNSQPLSYQAYISTGTSFLEGVPTPSNIYQSNSRIIPMDANGDAKTDIVSIIIQNDYMEFKIESLLAIQPYPDLLKSITNGQGGKVGIDYKPLTDPSVYAKDSKTNAEFNVTSMFNRISGASQNIANNESNGTGVNPPPTMANTSPQYVVSNYQLDDGQGSSYQYWMAYAGGRTSLDGRGWLGFAEVTKYDESLGSRITRSFLQEFPFTHREASKLQCGDQPEQGLILLNAAISPCLLTDKYLLKTFENTYFCENTESDVASVLATNNKIDIPCEIDATYHPYSAVYQVLKTGLTKTDTAFGYQIEKHYAYDEFGNLTQFSNLGDVNNASNPVYQCMDYLNDTTNDWYIGFLQDRKTSSISSCPTSWSNYSFGSGDLNWVQRQYNPTTLQLSSSASWDNGNHIWFGRQYGYDAFGNLTTHSRVSGNPAIVVPNSTYTTTFDDYYHTFPATRTTPLPQVGGKALVTHYAYDPRFGKRIAKQDANGLISTRCFDGFGRIAKTQGPIPLQSNVQNDTNCLNATTYPQLSQTFLGAKVATLTEHTWSDPGNDGSQTSTTAQVRDTWAESNPAEWPMTQTYIDGLNRHYQQVTTGDQGNIVTQQKYQTPKLVSQHSIPRYDAAPEYWITKKYDTTGRHIQTTIPHLNSENNKITEVNTNWCFTAPNTITKIEASDLNGEACSQYTGQYKSIKQFEYYNSKRKTVQLTLPKVSKATNQNVSTFEYDDLGRITTRTGPIIKSAPTGVINSIDYDSLSRKTKLTESNMGTHSFFYNTDNGKLKYKQDAKGQTINFTYDNLKRKLTKSMKDSSSTTTETITYVYDVPSEQSYQNVIGRLSYMELVWPSSTNDPAEYTYGYNAYGKVNRKAVALGQNKNQSYLFEKTYSPLQHLTSLTYPDGAVATRTYTDAANLQTVDYTEAGASSAAPYATYSNHNAFGMPTQINYLNDTTEQQSYDPTGRVQSQLLTAAGGVKLLSEAYEWNTLSDLTDIVDCNYKGNTGESVCNGITGENETDYSQAFELENKRLVSATADASYGEQHYEYDNAGNMIYIDDVTYTYDGQQVIGGDGAAAFSAEYDANGSMQSKTLGTVDWAYTFDVKNRLIEVEASGKKTASFNYNAQGRRITKTAYKPDSSIEATTQYISPSYNISGFGNSDEPSQSTTYLGSPYGTIASITKSLVDSKPADTERKDTKTSSVPAGYPIPGTTSFYHRNQVNSTKMVTNSAGELASNIIYKPYGGIFKITPTDSDHYRPKYGSKEYDDNTDLYYFNARYYDPVIGRFISADTRLGGNRFQQDAYNRYEYGLDNPVKYMDPSGHLPCGKIGIAAAGVGFLGGASSVSLTAGPLTSENKSKSQQTTEIYLSAIAGTFGAGTLGAGLGWSCERYEKNQQAKQDAAREQEQRDEEGYDGDDEDNGDIEGDFTESDSSSIYSSDSSYSSYSSCSSSTSSFVPRTKVSTSTGLRSIDDINKGDLVWAYNTSTSKSELRKVTHTHNRFAPDLVLLTLGSEQIETTAEHKFWVDNKAWVEAKDLNPGDRLRDQHGNEVLINKIIVQPGTSPVFNLTVEEHHNYYVSSAKVLSHNCNTNNDTDNDEGDNEEADSSQGSEGAEGAEEASEAGEGAAENAGEASAEASGEAGIEAGAEAVGEAGAEAAGEAAAEDALLLLLLL